MTDQDVLEVLALFGVMITAFGVCGSLITLFIMAMGKDLFDHDSDDDLGLS